MKYELDLYDKWCEGKEEGIKEGRDEGILQTAAAALKQGVPLETVAAFTGLPQTRLEELQRSL